MRASPASSASDLGRKNSNEQVGPAASSSSILAMPSSGSGVGPSEVVFETDDVVLSEVLAVLDFDETTSVVAGVLDAMGGPDRDVDGLPGAESVTAPSRVTVAYPRR